MPQVFEHILDLGPAPRHVLEARPCASAALCTAWVLLPSFSCRRRTIPSSRGSGVRSLLEELPKIFPRICFRQQFDGIGQPYMPKSRTELAPISLDTILSEERERDE